MLEIIRALEDPIYISDSIPHDRKSSVELSPNAFSADSGGVRVLFSSPYGNEGIVMQISRGGAIRQPGSYWARWQRLFGNMATLCYTLTLITGR